MANTSIPGIETFQRDRGLLPACLVSPRPVFQLGVCGYRGVIAVHYQLEWFELYLYS